ncbi:PDZ domain-containing protein MAGIX [Ammospiza nelsoni]|uniref:PDZ domain-containing protein MAGIX n=1 Tax=Ammospiza nelsoni TaxID=2857394 RepID=UPI00286B1995|nr:PDZ domain-containing protein MAGIX [Ammospiza nelsoni]
MDWAGHRPRPRSRWSCRGARAGSGSASGEAPPGFFVRGLREGGPAQRCGCIQVSDELLAINGAPTAGMSHAQALARIRGGGSRLRLLLRRPHGSPPAPPARGVLRLCVGSSPRGEPCFCLVGGAAPPKPPRTRKVTAQRRSPPPAPHFLVLWGHSGAPRFGGGALRAMQCPPSHAFRGSHGGVVPLPISGVLNKGGDPPGGSRFPQGPPRSFPSRIRRAGRCPHPLSHPKTESGAGKRPWGPPNRAGDPRRRTALPRTLCIPPDPPQGPPKAFPGLPKLLRDPQHPPNAETPPRPCPSKPRPSGSPSRHPAPSPAYRHAQGVPRSKPRPHGPSPRDPDPIIAGGAALQAPPPGTPTRGFPRPARSRDGARRPPRPRPRSSLHVHP